MFTQKVLLTLHLAAVANCANLSFDPIQESTVYNFRPASHFEKFSHDENAYKEDKKYRREHLQNWSLRRGGGGEGGGGGGGTDSASASTSDDNDHDDTRSFESVRPPPPTPPRRPQTTRHTPPIWSQPDANRPYFDHHSSKEYADEWNEAKKVMQADRNQDGDSHFFDQHHQKHPNEHDQSEEWHDSGATNKNRWVENHDVEQSKPKPNHTLRIKPVKSAQTPLETPIGPPIGPWTESHRNDDNESPKFGQKVTTLWNVAPHGGYVLTEETVLKMPDFRSDHPGATWVTPVTHQSQGNRNKKKPQGWFISDHPVRTQLTTRSRSSSRSTTTTTQRPWNRNHRRHHPETTTRMRMSMTWLKRRNKSSVEMTTMSSPSVHNKRYRGQKPRATVPTTVQSNAKEPLAENFDEAVDHDDGDLGSDRDKTAWGLLGQRDSKANGTVWQRKDDPLTSKRLLNPQNDEMAGAQKPEFEEDYREAEPRL